MREAMSDWSFTNTTTQAVFNESFYVSNIFFGDTFSDTSIFDSLRVTLTEPVNYSVTGTIFATPNTNGCVSWTWVSVLFQLDSRTIVASQQWCLAQ